MVVALVAAVVAARVVVVVSSSLVLSDLSSLGVGGEHTESFASFCGLPDDHQLRQVSDSEHRFSQSSSILLGSALVALVVT